MGMGLHMCTLWFSSPFKNVIKYIKYIVSLLFFFFVCVWNVVQVLPNLLHKSQTI